MIKKDLGKWRYTRRKNRVIPNGPVAEYVVHRDRVYAGICVCFSTDEAQQVCDALNARDEL